YVGRVCHQKGTDTLLAAYSHASALRERCQLVIAGPIGQFGMSGDPENWRERIKEAGGTYLGPVQERDLAATYNMASVFILPTRHLEMFGMAAVEAQACGKPVVTTAHGGLFETVSSDSGVHVKPGDSGALALAALRLFDDRAVYE